MGQTAAQSGGARISAAFPMDEGLKTARIGLRGLGAGGWAKRFSPVSTRGFIAMSAPPDGARVRRTAELAFEAGAAEHGQ
jgi:hypothetical protein